jgi:uncharacterized Zn finger protein (UPF0148 family)
MVNEAMDFWRTHIANFNETTGMGRCPLCGSLQFSIQAEGKFSCPRCNLEGIGVEEFIEQVREHKGLHHPRRIVREWENRKALEAEAPGLSRDEISVQLVELEDRRGLVWNAIAEKTVGSEIVEGEEERSVGNLESLDALTEILVEELKQDEVEIRTHLVSLLRFKDIEVEVYHDWMEREVTAIRVRYLYRNGAREFIPQEDDEDDSGQP